MTDVRQRVMRFIDGVLANPNRREAYGQACARWERVRQEMQQLERPAPYDDDDVVAAAIAAEADAKEADLAYEATILRTLMWQFEMQALLESEARLRNAHEN